MEEMTLQKKLSAIQSRLVAPKGQYNKFGGYKYRSCEDILNALKQFIGEYGVSVRLTDDIAAVGNRFYVKATASITDGVSTIETVAFAREDETKKGMDASQVTGAASSYARKYALNGLFCIDDTKDADATNTHGNDKPAQEAQNRPATASAPSAEDAIKEVANAATMAALSAVWGKYTHLHNTPAFKLALTERKNVLRSNGETGGYAKVNP